MTIEDEAWRSYLESDSVGLTIASSDEDTAGALATLYEYYKVPVTKRQKIAVSASNSPTPKVIKVEPESSLRQTINVTTSPTGGITLATKPKSPESDFRSELLSLIASWPMPHLARTIMRIQTIRFTIQWKRPKASSKRKTSRQ